MVPVSEVQSVMSTFEEVREEVRQVLEDRDRFQRLAVFYDGIIRNYVATYLPKETDGSPCWGGRSPAAHLVEMTKRRLDADAT